MTSVSTKHVIEVEDEPSAKRPKPEENKVPPEFICSVCIDILVSPHILPCGHSICEYCVTRLVLRRCTECRQPFKTTTPNLVLRNFLATTFPDAYTQQEARILNGWETDYCEPTWTRWLPQIRDRLDRFTPVTAAQCDAFAENTTTRLITGPSSSAFAWGKRHRSSFGKPARDDIVAVLRKNDRVYILQSTSKQFAA